MKTTWLALAVPLLAIAELLAQCGFAHWAPTPEQWAAIRPAVAALHEANEPLIVAPYWAEPMARWKLGNDLMPAREVARPDVTRYRKAIELSAMSARAPELAGWQVGSETRVGPITIRTRINPAPASVTFDFTDHVQPERADARVERGSTFAPCAFSESAPLESGGLGGMPTFPAARFLCPPEPSYVFVGVTIIEDQEYRPRRCIWSHPPKGGELVTRFRSVPLGTSIRGHAGMGWIQERFGTGASFTLRVLVDGTEVGRVVHADGAGWKPFEMPLGDLAHATGDVEFRASAGGGGRPVCFEADSR